jgi:tetratricopeptide (TPR) repeat protein
VNSTLRTILVFIALVAAVLIASTVYRRSAVPPETNPAAEPVAVDESTLHPEMQNGLRALREGRDDQAIAHFRAVPTDSSDFAAAQLRGAVALAKRGDLEEAQLALFQVTERHPDNPEALASLAWLFYLDADYDRAERTALRTLELDPAHLPTRYNIALYRVGQGRTQAAVRSYLRAMREDPAGREISVHRERLYTFHETHPDVPAGHYALAFLANSMQDRRTEVDELEHYLELVPEGSEAESARQKLSEAREILGAS